MSCRELMEEPPGGHGFGRRRADASDGADWLPLEPGAAKSRAFLQGGGWTIAHRKSAARAGMVTHRGILHPAEYVDRAELRARLEEALGFTLAEARSVYARGARGGPLPFAQRALRARLDARLLELADAGCNMSALATLLGFKRCAGEGGRPSALRDALKRARAAASTV